MPKRSKYLPPEETRTLTEIAREAGISKSLLHKRLTSGKSLKEAVAPPYVSYKSKYVPSGESRTLSQLARDNGMTYRRVYARLKRGIPLQQALDPRRIIPRSGLIPEGENRTLKALAEESGLAKTTLVYRLRSGMSLSDAMSRARSPHQRAVGKYESLAAVARLAGISRERVRQLVNKGVDPEAIASRSYSKGTAGKCFPGTPEKLQGKSLKDIAKEWKVPYVRVRKLYSKGLTFEQAHGLSKTQVSVMFPGTPKKYQGKTLSFIAKDLGVTYAKLYYYCKKGYTYKEAMERVLAK